MGSDEGIQQNRGSLHKDLCQKYFDSEKYILGSVALILADNWMSEASSLFWHKRLAIRLSAYMSVYPTINTTRTWPISCNFGTWYKGGAT